MQPIRLNDHWRVGWIAKPPQYVLQQRSILKSGEERWDGVSFCQYQETLLRAIKEKVTHARDYYQGTTSMPVHEEVMAQVRALPQEDILMMTAKIADLIREARLTTGSKQVTMLGKALEDLLDERGDLMRQVQRLEDAFKDVRMNDPALADELAEKHGLGEL